MDDTRQYLLTKCLHLIRKYSVCPETTLVEWPRILSFAHDQGYLYVNRDASTFCMAYRIPEWKEEYSDELPAQEGGDILYCAFAVSESDRRVNLLKMLKDYLKENDISELIYYRNNSNSNLKRFNIRKNNVEAKSSPVANCA